MAQLKGSKTEQCLKDAFAGESQARNRYTYFSSVAAKEGYVQIANIFADTAENEKEHANESIFSRTICDKHYRNSEMKQLLSHFLLIFSCADSMAPEIIPA